jgi:hypothetical protein
MFDGSVYPKNLMQMFEYIYRPYGIADLLEKKDVPQDHTPCRISPSMCKTPATLKSKFR